MNETIQKLNLVKDQVLLEKENAVLRLFMLLERTDLDDKWDLLISADWIEVNNSQEDLIYIITKLKLEFGDKLDFLSKIILMNPNEEFINLLIQAIKREDLKNGTECSLRITDNFVLQKIYLIHSDFQNFKFTSPVKEENKINDELKRF